jgi:hypothetical protein
MSLILKDIPVGVDIAVNNLQTYLWDNISWNKDLFTDANYESYHRAYRNETNGTEIWEVFTSGKDYIEVLYDDKFLATSFFVVDDNVNINETGKETTNMSIIFQVNLQRLYPSVIHRADEEAHREVMSILKDNPWSYKLTTIVKGIRNVYSELGYGANKFEDMQPFHVFRIDFEGVKASC